jgi:hypothetical protein
MITALLVLCAILIALIPIVGSASYKVGRRTMIRGNDTLLDTLIKDTALGRTIWQKMVADAIRSGSLDAQALVDDRIHLFHRLAEDDQRLILEAARSTLRLLRSDFVALETARMQAATSPPGPPTPPAEAPT